MEIARLGDDIRQPLGHDYYQQMMAFADSGESNLNDENYFRKALTSQTAGSGSEFIPNEYSANIIKWVYLKSWARQTFGTLVIRFGDNITLPKENSALTPNAPELVSAEITAALGSATAIREEASTTTSVTLTLSTIAINMQVQNKYLAYNVMPRAQVESRLRERLIKELVEAEEDIIVNGDTTTGASNINNAYDATNHPHGQSATRNQHLLMTNGLRLLATGTQVDAGGSSISTTHFTNAKRNLGKYGAMPDDYVYLISLDLNATVIRFSQVETLETYGPRATIMTGEVGKMYGTPVIVIDKLPSTFNNTLTNSSGVRSSSTATNTRTEAIAVYKNSPLIGVPADQDRVLNVAVKEFPEYDRKHLIARQDWAFNVAYPDAIVRIINIATS